MNKQELIEEIEDLKDLNQLFGNNPGYIKIDTVMGLVSKLDEPQKVQVPQIVADYIKYTKDADWDLQEAMDDVAYEDNKDLRKWFNNNIETFVHAWLDGYEVEEEKRYLVKVKGVDSCFECLYYGMGSNTWSFRMKDESGYFRQTHTRKELEEAGFCWVFDCEGIEIEEVE